MYMWSWRQAKQQPSWRRLSSMHEAWKQQRKNEKKWGFERRRRQTQILHCWRRCGTVYAKLRWSKQSSSSSKKDKERTVSGSSVSDSRKHDRRSKMTSGGKDLCGNTTEKINQESGKTKVKTPHSSCFKKWDQHIQVKESKKWYASPKAADGMQYWRAKRGGQTSQKFGKHTRNTCSWKQENTTTNTELGWCWTGSGDNKLSTPNTISPKIITVLTRYRPIVLELIKTVTPVISPGGDFFGINFKL